MSERIKAPRRIVEAMENAQRQVERINLEVQAIVFGAAAALDVPEGWQWDGSGWKAPDNEKPAE
mgnify:FL=1